MTNSITQTPCVCGACTVLIAYSKSELSGVQDCCARAVATALELALHSQPTPILSPRCSRPTAAGLDTVHASPRRGGWPPPRLLGRTGGGGAAAAGMASRVARALRCALVGGAAPGGSVCRSGRGGYFELSSGHRKEHPPFKVLSRVLRTTFRAAPNIREKSASVLGLI